LIWIKQFTRQVGLGAIDLQGLWGRSSGMPQVLRADAGNRADRWRNNHSPDSRTSGPLGAARSATESACATEATAGHPGRSNL